MKHVFLVFLLATSCLAYSQRKPKIKGNKNVIEVREALPPFNAIELKDDLEIKLQAGASGEYTIEADDNLIDILKFNVENETLVISSYYKVTSKKKLDITVNFSQLYNITAHEGLILVKDRFSTDFLEVNALGTGRVEIEVDADTMLINMDGNSRGDFKINSDSLKVSLKDKADLRLYGVMKTMVLDTKQSSKADLEGFTTVLALNVFNSSSVKAQRMEVNNVKASLEHSASAEILATDTLELSSKGAAKTYVYGPAKISLLEFADTSELYKRKD